MVELESKRRISQPVRKIKFYYLMIGMLVIGQLIMRNEEFIEELFARVPMLFFIVFIALVALVKSKQTKEVYLDDRSVYIAEGKSFFSVARSKIREVSLSPGNKCSTMKIEFSEDAPIESVSFKLDRSLVKESERMSSCEVLRQELLGDKNS